MTTKTQLKNVAAIQRVCEKKGYSIKLGPQQVPLFGSQVQCDVSVKLPGWNYPVAINTETGDAKYDTYNGHWGDIKHFNDLQQEYAVAVVEEQTQGLVAEGWVQEQQVQQNGDIQLILTHE